MMAQVMSRNIAAGGASEGYGEQDEMNFVKRLIIKNGAVYGIMNGDSHHKINGAKQGYSGQYIVPMQRQPEIATGEKGKI
jgi:hypothetical protein